MGMVFCRWTADGNLMCKAEEEFAKRIESYLGHTVEAGKAYPFVRDTILWEGRTVYTMEDTMKVYKVVTCNCGYLMQGGEACLPVARITPVDGTVHETPSPPQLLR